MKVKLRNNFFYRIKNENEKELYSLLNTSKENVIRNNNKLAMYPGEMVYITINNYITHVVKPTDTLISICDKYKMNPEKVKQDNNLKTSKLYIGQIIKIYNEDK